MVAASSDDSSSQNAPPQIADQSLVVSHGKASPAQVGFVLIDAEGDRVTGRLQVRRSDETGEKDFRPLLLVAGPGGDPPPTLESLATAGSGLGHARLWDFETQLGSGAMGEYEVRLQLLGSGGVSVASARRLVFVGNRLPTLTIDSVELDPASAEASGNVDIQLSLTDPTPGSARCRVEFSSTPDAPDSWRVARPAGTPASAEPPAYFLADLPLTEVETTTFFVWDSVADAVGSGHVRLRFRVDEEVASGEFLVGEPAETELFAVDNNAKPVAILDNELFGLHSDERRVLAVPFQLFDAEEDRVDLVVQWRRPTQAFPQLPTDPESIAAILRDPAQREAFRVCAEAPRQAQGALGALPPGLDDPTRRLRLGELAGSESAFLAHGRGAREIELLRPASLAEPVVFEHELDQPVALLPLGSGTHGLALDRSGPDWRMARVALADGALTGPSLSGPGRPTALALAPDESAAFVAAISAQGWTITRLALEPLALAGTSTGVTADPAGVRGLLALDAERVLFTADDRLSMLAVRSGGPPATLQSGLAEPWGLARMPRDPERVLLSERGGDRVTEVDLLRHAVRVLPASTLLAGPALPSPRALSVEGAHLLVVTEPVPGEGRVRLLPLGTTLRSDGAESGPATALVAELPDLACEPGAGLASGPDGLRVLADPRRERPLLAGGIERTIELGTPAVSGLVYHPETQTVEVRAPLQPEPAPGTPWRIRATTSGFASGSETPRSGTFAWDTRDVVAGEVHLRLTPLDDDVGLVSEGLGAKSIRTGFAEVPVSVTDPALEGAAGIALGDLDGDGDLDVGTANEGKDNENGFTLFCQAPDRSWSAFGPVLPYGLFPRGPTALRLLDLDGDGRLDVFGAIPVTFGDAGAYYSYLQRAPEAFTAAPLCSVMQVCAERPRDLVAADLDGDGDLDLAAAEQKGDRLIAYQVTPPTVPGTDPSYLRAVFSRPNTLLGVNSLAVADLDQDGDLDLAGTAFDDNSLGVVYQEAPGFWGPAGFSITEIDALLAPKDVLAADVNTDGRVDLVVATDTVNDLTLLTNTPQGFSARVLGPDSPAPGNLVALDCDVDGDLDLAYTVGDSVALLPQIGPDRFASETILLPIEGAGGLTGLASADLDGDTDFDLLVTDGGARRLSILYQGGRTRDAGSFTSGQALQGGLTSAERGFALGDLDGDVDLDVVSLDIEGGSLSVWSQLSPGRFQPSADGPIGGLAQPRWTEAVDVDGDAELDLITASRGAGQIVIHARVRGEFEQRDAFGDATTNARVEALTAADLDGDGLLDVATANQGASTLTIFRQENDGDFGPIAQTLPVDAPSSLLAADLDRDGDLDLAAGLALTNQLALFYNLGPAGLGVDPLDLLQPTATPTSIAAADLDGDGWIEILSAGNGSWSVFARASTGAFGPAPLHERPADAAFNLANAIDAGDLDSDGRTDVVLVSLSGSFPSLRLYSAIAPGLFDAARWTFQELGTGSDRATALRIRDLDGDQDLDVILGTRTGVRPLYRRH